VPRVPRRQNVLTLCNKLSLLERIDGWVLGTLGTRRGQAGPRMTFHLTTRGDREISHHCNVQIVEAVDVAVQLVAFDDGADAGWRAGHDQIARAQIPPG
jgi:hypothetical protein